MNFKTSKGMLMTALITGVLFQGSAFAAETEDAIKSFQLDPMFVTATRYEKNDVDIPASVEVFTERQLESTGGTNLYEALQYGTGIEAIEYGTGGSSLGAMSSKLAIRGNNNGTLVLVNGSPINLHNAYDLTDFPVEIVDRVEVVRGGGSVLYGSEATGGVINIITKKKNANYVKAALGNRGQQEYSGAMQAGSLGFRYKYNKWGTVNKVGRNFSSNPYNRHWHGPENNSFNLNYEINKDLMFEAGHTESRYRYTTDYDGTTADYDYGYKNKRNNFQLRYDNGDFKVNAYYVDRNLHGIKKFISGKKAGEFDSNKVYKESRWGLDAQKKWELHKSTALFGATYERETYSEDDKLKHVSTSQGMQTRNAVSVYGQYDWRMTDADNLIAAGRYTALTGSPKGNNVHNFSGQLQYLRKLNDHQSVYASVGQSFKVPDLNKIYKAEFDLKPQKGVHYEIGWKNTIDENRALKAAVYHYVVKDNIAPSINSKSGETEYSNEDIRNTGVEVKYDMHAQKGFGYHVSVAYSNPQTRDQDKNGYRYDWEDNYSKFEAGVGLTYNMNKWHAAINAKYYNGKKNYKNVGPTELVHHDSKPTLLTGLNIEYKADKNHKFFANFKNLLNRKDVIYLSGTKDVTEHYTTPFNFMVGYQYTF